MNGDLFLIIMTVIFSIVVIGSVAAFIMLLIRHTE